jgi:hypothetical protein
VTEPASESPTLASAGQAVINVTRDFLANEADADAVLDAVRNYHGASDLFAAEVSVDAAEQDDIDSFSPTEARSRLFWAAVSDLLVFRCIGLVDCWAALHEPGVVTTDDDLAQFGEALRADLEQAGVSFAEDVRPALAGGAIDDLKDLACTTMNTIAEESMSHVLRAMSDVLGGLIPAGTPSKAMRVLRRVGRVLGLEKLLDWAKRILDLALIKMRRVFGAGFDAIVEDVTSFLDEIFKVRERIANSMFRLDHLWAECVSAIDVIEKHESAQQIDRRYDSLAALSGRFGSWSLGLDIADVSLKWGWRVSVVSPPVALALATVRSVLAAGAFLIGRYHLDSPELAFLPWGTRGVLSVLEESAAANPGPTIKGDDGF